MHHMMREIHGEAAGPEYSDHRIHVLEYHQRWVLLRLDYSRCPGVTQERSPRREDPLPDRALPISFEGWRIDLADDDIDHSIQELFLAGHVLVEPHRDDPQLLRELAHAERFNSGVVGQGDSRP